MDLKYEKPITTSQISVKDTREWVSYVFEQGEGVILGVFLVFIGAIIFTKTPFYTTIQKSKELEQENNRKLTSNYVGVTETLLENRRETVENRKAIEELSKKVDHLERHIDEMIDDCKDEIKQDIRDIKNVIEMMRATFQNRRMF